MFGPHDAATIRERVSEPSTSSGAIIVLAKQPSPGAVKTRLCPPCSPEQAAAVAEAALVDTLDTVASTGAARKVLVLEGQAGDWLPEGIAVRHQRGQGLAERIAAAFADVGGPALLIGMDTPSSLPGRLTERSQSSADRTSTPSWDAATTAATGPSG